MGVQRRPDVSQYVSKLIKQKARRLVGCCGFTRSDRQDIEQELMLYVLRKMKLFDPERGSEAAFVGRIVDHKIASMRRFGSALRRDYRRVRPLGHRCDHGEFTDVAVFEADESANDMAIDLASLIAMFDPDWRKLCELLLTESVAETARRLGLPRGVIRGRLRTLRSLLRDAGMRVYLNE